MARNFSISQELCSLLLNIETNFDDGLTAARSHIKQQNEVFADQLAAWVTSVSTDDFQINAAELSNRLLSLIHPAVFHRALDAAESSFVFAQYAPIGLLDGCVLQNIAHAGNNHEQITAKGHLIHSWYVGAGNYTTNHAVLYRQLLENSAVHLPAICSDRFAGVAGTLPAGWALPAWWLSLSLFPDEYQAEILGVALFGLAAPVPGLLQAATGVSKSAWLQAKQSPEAERMLITARAAIEEALDNDDARAIALRIANGFLISRGLLEVWLNEVAGHLEAGYLSPQQAMLRLIQQKAKYAVGYHSRLKLDKQPFDSLIVQDSVRFLKMLGQSRWVSPGRPDESLLLTQLIALGGPMFRIFSDDEVTVIRNWISAIPTTSCQPAEPCELQAAATATCPVVAAPDEPASTIKSAESVVTSAGMRDLFHQLLNIERYPQARHTALGFATTWLARSAVKLERGVDALPFGEYSHARLRAWFEARALAQAQSYVINPANPDVIDKTRDEVIDEALQLCPMILIDGAWLQRWGNAGMVDSPIGALLYKIFSDEIGNGDTRLNHPNIYRALMAQMGVELPDFRSPEFAHYARFDDESFAVPAFWLSVSQYPRRFQPETLGLNLAMELSGVGGAYRTARDELRHYGFSTSFVDLHNTIDNVSSGHSAMARDAIEMHMDTVLQTRDPQLTRAHWHRVWTGFRALSQPKRRWTELFARPRYAL